MSERDEARARRGVSPPPDDDSGATPAHAFGRRRRPPVQGRRDRRSLATRLPVVIAVAAVLAAALAVDDGPALGAGDTDRPAGPRAQRLMPASPPPEARSSTWYCAAGTADDDGMADHTVTMFNPTGEARKATLSAYRGDFAPTSAVAEPVVRRLTLPAHDRVQVRLADLVDAPLAAALVEVDGGGVAVEHRVAGTHGADTAPCASTAASTWHLAWGATTRDARDIVVLFNPFPSSATVDAVFTTEDGGREPVRYQGFPLPPGSVVGVDLGEDVTRNEQVSATFTVRSGAIVVEHIQQHDGGLGTRGLSLTPAVPAAGETWVFADSVAAAPSPATPAPAAGSDADVDGEDGGEGSAGDGGAGDGEDGGEGSAGDGGAGDVDGEDDGHGGAGDGGAGDEGSDEGEAVPDDEPVPTERIVVYNPGEQRAEVDVSLVPMTSEPLPAPQPFRLRVGPGDYQVVDYGAEARVVPGVQHATVVRSTNGVPVVAERVAIDQGAVPERTGRSSRRETPDRRTETAASMGSRLAASTWRFPSLADPDDDESTVTLTVYNPDPLAAVDVEVELVSDPPDPDQDDADADGDDADGDDADGDDVDGADADGGDADGGEARDGNDGTRRDAGGSEDTGSEEAGSEEAGSEDTGSEEAGREGPGREDTGESRGGDPAGVGSSPSGDGLDGPVRVPPGAMVSIELDAATAAEGSAASVVATGPVVVDRVVRLGDGRRQALGFGIPAAEGAVPLDRLADAGPLGGVFSN